MLLQKVVHAYWGSANETVGFAPACVTGFTSHKTLQMVADAEGIIALEQRGSSGDGERRKRMTSLCNHGNV